MEIGEMVSVSNTKDSPTKCPFCPNKNLDQCKSEEKPNDEEVVSKPSQLKCAKLTASSEYSYTTAAHHLISAKQCYAKLKRLVRMGKMAGYDINAPKNGISLPTISNDLRYTVGNSTKASYGDLSITEKKTVAFQVMSDVKAQWHVGHHAVQVRIEANWAEEEQNADWRRGHLVSYDSEVLAKLLDILSKYKPESSCEEKKVGNIKKDLDDLSDKIKAKLNKFKSGKPWESAPFFVSQLAAGFASKNAPVTPKKIKKPLSGD